jgi:hypothetical protein
MSSDTTSQSGASNAGTAVAVSLTYSPLEDRLVGIFGEGERGVTVLLTRRLVRQTITRLAQLLERSSPMAERAPAAMRADVVQIEHQSAVAQLATRTGEAAVQALNAAASRAPALLVTQVNLTPSPPGFLLMLGGAGGHSVTLRLQWRDLHRLLGALRQQARKAEWDLADAVPWLAPPSEPPSASS